MQSFVQPWAETGGRLWGRGNHHPLKWPIFNSIINLMSILQGSGVMIASSLVVTSK